MWLWEGKEIASNPCQIWWQLEEYTVQNYKRMYNLCSMPDMMQKSSISYTISYNLSLCMLLQYTWDVDDWPAIMASKQGPMAAG